jgi:hypothetical protein
MSQIKKIFSKGMSGKIAALSKVLPKKTDAKAADAARYQALAANAASRNRLMQAKPFGTGTSKITQFMNKVNQTDAKAADAARYQALAANAVPRNRLQNVDALRNLLAKGGAVGSASKRADGIASKGKTKGRVL